MKFSIGDTVEHIEDKNYYGIITKLPPTKALPVGAYFIDWYNNKTNELLGNHPNAESVLRPVLRERRNRILEDILQ
jgi:hypothetical protein